MVASRRSGGFSRAFFAAVVVLVAMLIGGGAAARADGPTPADGVPTPQPGFLTDQEVAEYKAAHDPEPRPPPLSQEDQDWLAKKEAMVQDWLATRAQMAQASEGSPGAASASPCADFNGDGIIRTGDISYVVLSYGTIDFAADLNGDGIVRTADILVAVSQYGWECQRSGVTFIGRTYQGQVNGDYCGPAAVSEALVIKGIQNVDQNAAAPLLTTTAAGTPWFGWNGNPGVPSGYDTGYPVRDVLNYKIGTTWYMPQALPETPSSSDTSTYISHMTFDINNHWPVIGDAYEVAGSLNHLAGHPINQTILHWFTISGYENSGNGTNYMDSATTVWPTVQGWNTNFPSSTLVIILGGRGYVW